MSDWRNEWVRRPLCKMPGCFNAARLGMPYCQSCHDHLLRGRGTGPNGAGRRVTFCKTPGCEREAAPGWEYCIGCISNFGDRFWEEARRQFEREDAEAQTTGEDPRIAKLQAVVDDAASTDAEKSTARSLIERLRAKSREVA